MTMGFMTIYTTQALIFELIVGFMIIISTASVYMKARELFKLSLQKGLNYFYRAFLVYTFCFSINILSYLLFYFIPSLRESLIANIISGYLSLFTGALGGIYLGYSLMWRKFEKDRIKRHHLHIYLKAYGVAACIAIIQIYLSLKHNDPSSFFFAVMLLYLGISIYINRCCYDKHCHERSKSSNPFISSVTLSIFVYLAIFLEQLLFQVLPNIHVITWVMIVVFVHGVEHNVQKIYKGEF
jgi:hypothetical protein